MLDLPKEFTARMKDMLGCEFEDFIASFDKNKFQALRINTLKNCAEETVREFALQRRVEWCESAYYYDADKQPGKNPLHDGGAYYIQEPSAMAVVENLDVREGDVVLDLCAAPGGKSSQIAAKLNSSGLLVANEIIPSRAKILSQNIERMGVKNCIVLNESPQSLSGRFAGVFDRILVDAPCSGEGMFRKNPLAIGEWSIQNVQQCKTRQTQILDCARKMLKSGGLIVYSTCTFSVEENEEVIEAFLEKYDDFEVAPSKYKFCSGYASGKDGDGSLALCNRIYPHRWDGEGHFFAILRHKGEERDSRYDLQKREISPRVCKEYQEWEKDALNVRFEPNLSFGDSLYAVPDGAPRLQGLKVERAGLHLGVSAKNRFMPSHSLALALKPQDARRAIELDSEDALKYLGGQTLERDCEKGWALAVYKNAPLGWCKCDGVYAKNHYPKGLRR